MWMICGLGNPGKKYDLTRHNIGFKLIDSLINYYKFNLIRNEKKIKIYKGLIDNKICILCKPLTFMNLSGNVVYDVVNFYKISKKKLIIIHDDIDLKVGKIKIKNGGGNGGHKGLESIDNFLGKNYNRLRIGIDHPKFKNQVSTYVLEKFKKEEKDIIDKIIFIITDEFKLIFEKDRLFLTKTSLKIKKITNGI